MRSRRRYLSLAVLLGTGAAILPAVAGSETSPTIKAENFGSGYGYGETHAWSPSQVTVAAGGTVILSNPTMVNHGVEWKSPPVTPSCEEGTGKVAVGVSEAASGKEWSGKCKFTQPGTYTFWCTVHHAAMSGTITVKAPGTPTATTGSPAEVTQTSATLNGTVKPEGNATEYRFEYGTATVSEHTTSTLSIGSADFGSDPVSATLPGLAPSVKYRIQLVVIYGVSKTTVLGGEQMFTTLPVRPPTATTSAATSVSETGATLNGTVNPDGEATEYFFEYEPAPGGVRKTETKSLPADSGDHPVSATLTGLASGTEYHFRLIAKNKLGPAESAGPAFKTALPPPPSSPAPTPAPSPTTPTATIAITPVAPAEPMSGPPLVGGPSLRSSQQGSSVHGSLDVSQAGTGGRLEVDLLATGASLARARRPSGVRVGRYLRSAVQAGVVSFAVPLMARGKSALRRHRRLALTVRIVLTPARGTAVTVTKSVVLHG